MEMNEAVEKYLGYKPEQSKIDRALDYYDGLEIETLVNLLVEKLILFESDEQYGCSLAGAIDELKIVIAIYYWRNI